MPRGENWPAATGMRSPENIAATAAGPVYAPANAEVVALASSVQPAEPSARHTSSYTASTVGQVGFLAPELLRHHEPEQPGLVERLDHDRRQRGVRLRALGFGADQVGEAARCVEQRHE